MGIYLAKTNLKSSQNKGQSILEYTVVIACLIAALVAMSVYIKRGVEGRLRVTSDSIGEQYSPRNTESDIATSQEGDSTSLVYRAQGLADRIWFTIREDRIDKEETTRDGYETVGELENDLWAE